jgi:DNA repair protein RecN (Recombination protein N)
MLRELRIRDLAVIDELSLELGEGLTVLSGETGTGKSILVEALSLLVGERASADYIRAGADRARIEGRFEVDGCADILDRCERAGIEVEDGWLVLKRELQREGRHRAWINSSPATTSLVRELGDRLLDLHGQHEHQRLLHRPEQRRILDAFGGATELSAHVAEEYRGLRAVEERLAQARRRASEGRERADYLRFKADEIEAAGVEPDEEGHLERDARRLTHSEELLAVTRDLYDGIYDGEGSVVDRLGQLSQSLGELTRIDPEGQAFEELHETALRALEELGRRLGEYRTDIEHDPARLGQVRERLDELYRLKRKYGESLAEVIAAGHAARAELTSIEGSEDEIERLEAERSASTERLEAGAGLLSEARVAAARRLEETVGRSLPELGLAGGRFAVHLEPQDEVAPGGKERVEFRVSLNPGFEPAPLARVASGGEMSRLMLALKTALAEVDEVPILIFDEVDAGIGGEVAHRVAERLAGVAGSHQVLVVTHLAQIAARATAHLSVDKLTEGDRPRTRVQLLEGGDRVRELARMLGGDPESEVSRTHAEELLGAPSV